MATRYITHSRKDNPKSESEIVGVQGNDADGSFSYLTKQTVHDHIKAGTHVYYSRASGATDARVYAAGSGEGRYIQTYADKTAKNNLMKLPDC